MGRRNQMPSVPRGSSKSMAELFFGGERKKKKTGSHHLGEMFAPETCPELLRNSERERGAAWDELLVTQPAPDVGSEHSWLHKPPALIHPLCQR